MIMDMRLLGSPCLLYLLLVLAPISFGTAGGQRKLASTGDVLGVQYKPPAQHFVDTSSGVNVTKELQDHAHLYSAGEVFSHWAETTFALSAHAHRQLPPPSTSDTATACLYDGKQCLFNPAVVGSPSFPLPTFDVETVLKRFALEAHSCRGSPDTATCHLDTNCGWSDVTESCFLQHDPHPDFMAAIRHCSDALYSAANALCWRRMPILDAFRPCGPASCRLYKAGGKDSLPEDRCMPDKTPPGLKALDVYALMKRLYGSAMVRYSVGGVSAAPGGAPPSPGELAADEGVPVLEGFGSCNTAGLHFAMRTMCRQVDKTTCLSDSRCAWLTGVVRGQFCVLSQETAVQALLGSSSFTRTVLQMERVCAAATNAPSCSQVQLTVMPAAPQQDLQQQQDQQQQR